MNRIEQKNFIKALSKTVAKGIISDIADGKIPENWNGLELRQLLADRFAENTFGKIFRGKRKQDYENAKVVNNL